MTTSRPALRRRSTPFVVLIACLLGAFAAPTAAAPPPLTVTPDGGTSFGFTVRPYTAAGAQPRGALEYEAGPGQTVTDRVAIVNGTDKPKAFYIYAADAYNTSGSGGYALRLRTEERKDAGAWVTLPAPQFTIPGHQAALVPIQVTVPKDAEPGDHAAGIVAEEVVERPTNPKPGAGVSYVHRVAARMYIRVAGPVHPKLQVSSIKVAHTQPLIPGVTGHGGATITYTVRNSGNVRLTLNDVKLEVTGLLGRELASVDHNRKRRNSGLADDLLPGNSISFRAKLTSLPPIGQVTSKVTAKAIDPVVQKPLVVSRSSSFLVIPWFVLLLLAVLIAAIVLWRRRRRNRGDGTDDADGGDDAPTEAKAAAPEPEADAASAAEEPVAAP